MVLVLEMVRLRKLRTLRRREDDVKVDDGSDAHVLLRFVAACTPGRADGELRCLLRQTGGGALVQWSIDGVVRSQFSLGRGGVVAACWMHEHAQRRRGGATAEAEERARVACGDDAQEVLAVLFGDSLVLFDNSRGVAAVGTGGAASSTAASVGASAMGGNASSSGSGKESVIPTGKHYAVPVTMFPTPYGLLVQGRGAGAFDRHGDGGGGSDQHASSWRRRRSSIGGENSGGDTMMISMSGDTTSSGDCIGGDSVDADAERHAEFMVEDMYGDLHRCVKLGADGRASRDSSGETDCSETIVGVSSVSMSVFMFSERSQRHAIYLLQHEAGAPTTNEFDINTDTASSVSMRLLYRDDMGNVSTNLGVNGTNAAQKIVEVNDYDGSFVTCYLKGPRLELLKLVNWNEPARLVLSDDGSVVDVASIASTRQQPLRDLLVLRTDGSLELHSIFLASVKTNDVSSTNCRIMRISVPPPPPPPPVSPTMTLAHEYRLVQLTESVDDRITCVYRKLDCVGANGTLSGTAATNMHGSAATAGDGDDIRVRYSLSLQPRDMLVQDMVRVLQTSMSFEEHHNLLMRIVIADNSYDTRGADSVDAEDDPSSSYHPSDGERWDEIRTIIIGAVLHGPADHIISGDSGGENTTRRLGADGRNGDEAWAAVLASSVHQRLASTLSGYRALVSGETSTSCSYDDGTASDAVGNGRGYTVGRKQNVVQMDSRRHPRAFDSLEVLHALYEDYKLDKLKRSCLRKMNDVLCVVARELGEWWYVDHYIRDFAARRLSSTRARSMELSDSDIQNVRQPADIQRALYSLLRSLGNPSRKKSASDIGDPDMNARIMKESGHLPTLLLSQSVPDCLSWSRKVVRFFSHLGDEWRRSTNGGHLGIAGQKLESVCPLVSVMVEEGFGLTDLDRLPVGVALPLREALHAARMTSAMSMALSLPSLSSSPDGIGNWAQKKVRELENVDGSTSARNAAEAFILIGREDLAASSASSASPLPPPYSLFPRPSNDSVSALGHTEDPAYSLEDDLEEGGFLSSGAGSTEGRAAPTGGTGETTKANTGTAGAGDDSVDGMEGIDEGLTSLR